MPILHKNCKISPDDYLEGEQYSTVKHEFVRGEVHAMVGESRAHNLIANNLNVRLYQHLRGTACRVFIADVKVRVEQADAFFYPDLFVACDPEDRHSHYAERPVLIIEVSSPNTARFDEMDKRFAYQSLSSLKEYVLIEQEHQEVRVYRRADEGWNLEIFRKGEAGRLQSVGLELQISEVYEDISL